MAAGPVFRRIRAHPPERRTTKPGSCGNRLAAVRGARLVREWYVGGCRRGRRRQHCETGQTAVSRRVRIPSTLRSVRPLFHGGFGSLQLSVRRERLVLGTLGPADSLSTSPRADAVLGTRETATTVGVAWHLNRWIAIEGNLLDEHIGVSPAAASAMRIWSRLLRIQVSI
jgi:hypothetical protein